MMENAAINTSLDESILSQELVDSFVTSVIVFVNENVLCTSLCLFGAVTNVINSGTFVRQGLRTSINVSFLALSVSDLVRVLLLLWMCVSTFQFVDNLDSALSFRGVQYLTSAWPTACANRVTLFITAYVTVERYVSVSAPLAVKKLITPRRTLAVIIAVDVFNVLGLVPEYVSVHFDFRFFPEKNRTLLGLAFGSNRAEMQKATFAIHAALLVVALLTIITFTCLLVARLRRQSEWRQCHASRTPAKDAVSLSAKDKKPVKMVVAIATVMVVCYSPTVVLSVVSASATEFSIAGHQANLFNALWSFCFLFGVTNASLNIFIYYNMSSRYKKTMKTFLRIL